MRNFAIISLIIITNGCSLLHPHVQDGPPTSNLDLADTKDAIPKHEPKSKYGNPKKYVVMGKQYTVLNNVNDFQQSGIASWYGSKFNGRLTSNREQYNMFAMTAAHKTLPLPSYVKVTRTDTNQSIIVRVNDRGPFVENRIIDLSYAAAKKLNMLKYGTAPVEITVLNSNNAYWIQAGAFANQAYALQQKQAITKVTDSMPTIIHTDKWYRVSLGPFNTKKQAKNTSNQLKTTGFNNIIKQNR